MPLQQHLQYPETTSKEDLRLINMMEGMGRSLETKYQSYKGQRDEKEREWIKAIRQYEGQWDIDDLTKIELAISATNEYTDPISVNITRPKTNIAIARMKDIQFPTGGDFNFFLKPAPITAEIKAALQAEGPDAGIQMATAEAGVPLDQAPQPAEIAQSVVEQNNNGAPKMERLLRNHMIDAAYGTKARLAIEDLCIKGTAVMKGPTLENRKKTAYSSAMTQEGKPIQVLEEQWLPEGSVERVDPNYFFPDPSSRLPHEIEDAFELHAFSASDLIKLAKNPSFMKEQIRHVLKSDPDGLDAPEVVQETQNDHGQTNKNRYWVREYHGPLDKQVLHEAGMISDEDFEDTIKTYTGEVWFADKAVIRMSISHLEGIETIPYSLTVWEKDPNSVFGHGVPFLLRNAQRVVNNAYLMLLDNASLTSGPQIVLNKEMIQPASNDENYSIVPMKVWFLTEYGADVREAMQFVDIPAQMEPISQIIDASMQFADIESSTPLLQQGETPSGNNTTTGLAMVMSATNIIQKAASMSWDDHITKPLVQRWYHHEMQYGEDDTVKGDYEIEVGGATERIEAEIRAQEIERMLGLASSNEEFMFHVDSNKAFRALVDNTRTGDILYSAEEAEAKMQEAQAQAQQQAQQAADPEMIKAEAAMITAQNQQARAKSEAEINAQRLQMEMQQAEMRFAGESQLAQARNNEAEANYQLGIAKLAAEQNKTAQEIQRDLALGELDFELKLQLSEDDFQKMEREIEVKNKFGSGI